MLRQNSLAEFVLLNESNSRHACALKSERETADAGKHVEYSGILHGGLSGGW